MVHTSIPKTTAGEWNHACDSYGKVQHSQKYDCVYSVVKGNGGDRLVRVASRIENGADARLMAASKELYAALKSMNHMGGDPRGGYCICPRHDGSRPDIEHSTACADARQAIRKVESHHADHNSPSAETEWMQNYAEVA